MWIRYLTCAVYGMGSKGLIESGVFLLQQLEICGEVGVSQESCNGLYVCCYMQIEDGITAEPLVQLSWWCKAFCRIPSASITWEKLPTLQLTWLGNRDATPSLQRITPCLHLGVSAAVLAMKSKCHTCPAPRSAKAWCLSDPYCTMKYLPCHFQETQSNWLGTEALTTCTYHVGVTL